MFKALVLAAVLAAVGVGAAWGKDPRCPPGLVRASYYGKETCNGRPPGHGKGTCHTAAGVPFDGTQLLVAHKTLRLGTRVRVTYRHASLELPVLDRGPYIAGRTIDLSAAAAAALGTTASGVACVQLDVL